MEIRKTNTGNNPFFYILKHTEPCKVQVNLKNESVALFRATLSFFYTSVIRLINPVVISGCALMIAATPTL